MNEDLLLSAVAETFTEKPKYELTVNIEGAKMSWWEKLIRRRVETSKTFIIKPCKVVNMARVAGNSILLPKDILDGKMTEAVMPLMAEHAERMIYIIASAIQNNKHEPKPKLIDFLTNNMDAIDLQEGLTNSLEGLEMSAFLNSIVLAKGTVNFLKPEISPSEGSELIASHTELSEAPANTSVGA